MENSIKKMLRLTDKYLTIQGVSYEMFHQANTLVIEAVLAPPVSACSTCGSTVKDSERKTIIVKNGKKMTCIRFDQLNHLPLIMRLKKQRYQCRNCQTHWTAQSYFVRPNHSIAEHVRMKIIALLSEKVSLSFIAKHCQVSLPTMTRLLRSFKTNLPKQAKRHLPKVLMVDEFRSHVSAEDKMSFICADGETGQLVDVLPTRKLSRLTTYFQTCVNPSDVKYLVTYMNAAYFQLTQKVFPHAKLVIDRFHVVKHMKSSFP